MDVIKEMAVALCITCVASGIFYLLLPNNSLEKILKFSISLFFIVSLSTPFLNKDIDFKLNFDNIKPPPKIMELSLNAENQFITLASEKLENEIKSMLEKKDIKIKKIKLYININEDDSISINKLNIFPSDITQKDIIINLVYDEFNIKANVLA